MVDWPEPRTLGVVLYPGFDLLDVTGPLHAFGMLKNVYEQVLVGPAEGPVASAQGPALVADVGYEQAEKLHLLLVPGGTGVRKQLQDDIFRGWLAYRADEAELVMSVSGGAALLAKAGVLDGLEATCSTRGLEFASQQGPRVRWKPSARFVDAGKVITAAGVAAGLDMALHVITRMTAPDVGENVARSLEYEWNPDPANDAFAKS